MTELQRRYEDWVSTRELIEKSHSGEEITEESWRIRESAWKFYCEERERVLPSKKRAVVNSIYHRVYSS